MSLTLINVHCFLLLASKHTQHSHTHTNSVTIARSPPLLIPLKSGNYYQFSGWTNLSAWQHKQSKQPARTFCSFDIRSEKLWTLAIIIIITNYGTGHGARGAPVISWELSSPTSIRFRIVCVWNTSFETSRSPPFFPSKEGVKVGGIVIGCGD